MPRTFRRGAQPLEKWMQQAEAAVSTVERLSKLKAGDSLHGLRWNSGMLDYYKRRCAVLLANPPKGGQAMARDFTVRLSRV
jgi:hypothetical protein